jgi:hypothetical protein
MVSRCKRKLERREGQMSPAGASSSSERAQALPALGPAGSGPRGIGWRSRRNTNSSRILSLPDCNSKMLWSWLAFCAHGTNLHFPLNAVLLVGHRMADRVVACWQNQRADACRLIKPRDDSRHEFPSDSPKPWWGAIRAKGQGPSLQEIHKHLLTEKFSRGTEGDQISRRGAGSIRLMHFRSHGHGIATTLGFRWPGAD